MHFFLVARYETCLFMLTTISCNFKFVNTYISYDQITIHYSQCLFIFVYKITKDYNFLQGNLLQIFFLCIDGWGGDLNPRCKGKKHYEVSTS